MNKNFNKTYIFKGSDIYDIAKDIERCPENYDLEWPIAPYDAMDFASEEVEILMEDFIENINSIKSDTGFLTVTMLRRWNGTFCALRNDGFLYKDIENTILYDDVCHTNIAVEGNNLMMEEYHHDGNGMPNVTYIRKIKKDYEKYDFESIIHKNLSEWDKLHEFFKRTSGVGRQVLKLYK